MNVSVTVNREKRATYMKTFTIDNDNNITRSRRRTTPKQPWVPGPSLYQSEAACRTGHAAARSQAVSFNQLHQCDPVRAIDQQLFISGLLARNLLLVRSWPSEDEGVLWVPRMETLIRFRLCANGRN